MKKLMHVVVFVSAGSLGLIAACGDDTEPTTYSNPCCRVCKSGKACGDGCIAASSNCSKPSGCSCNG